jgi:rhodanese-related sulfurtransferase
MFNFLKPAAKAPSMTMQDVIAKAAKREILLVDVREKAELASGTAKGSIHVPVSLIGMKADPKGPSHDPRFQLGQPVAVFCASGGRSGMAAQVLQRLGYEAINLGGFSGWAEAGGPVVRG